MFVTSHLANPSLFSICATPVCFAVCAWWLSKHHRSALSLGGLGARETDRLVDGLAPRDAVIAVRYR